MGLLAGGVDLGDGFGQEPAVDDRAEVRRRRCGCGWSGRRCLRWGAAQLGELAGAAGGEGEGDVGFLALLERAFGTAAGGDAPPLSPMAWWKRPRERGEAM